MLLLGLFEDDNDSKRNLGIRDKQILFEKIAKEKCENPTCNRPLKFSEMQVGHKIAWSKGGRSNLKNSVCLCYACNKLQGTDSWVKFLKKQGHVIVNPKADSKKILDTLSLSQLKTLAKLKHIPVKGKVEEGFFSSSVKAPSKNQYVKKLSGFVNVEDVNALPPEAPKIKKKKPKSRGWF